MSQAGQNSDFSKKSLSDGYRIVLAGAVLVFLGSVVNNCANSWSMAGNKENSVASLALISAILTVVPLAAGPLIDRYGPRLFILLGVVLSGLGMTAIESGQPLGILNPFLVMFAIGYSTGSSLPIFASISQWFVRRRAFFLSVIAAASYAAWALTHNSAFKDWAGKIAILNNPLWFGLVILAAGIPLALVFKPRPGKEELFPEREDGSPAEKEKSRGARDFTFGDRSFRFRQSLRQKTFWLLAAALALGYGAVGAGQMLVFRSRMGSGYDQRPPGIPEGIKSLILIAVILVFGYLGDRLPKRYLLASIVTLQSAAAVLVIAAKSPAIMNIQNIIFNFSLVVSPLLFALCADYFGLRALATHYVFVTFLSNLAMGAITFGQAFFSKNELFGSLAVSVIGITSAVLFLWAKAPQAGREDGARTAA